MRYTYTAFSINDSLRIFKHSDVVRSLFFSVHDYINEVVLIQLNAGQHMNVLRKVILKTKRSVSLAIVIANLGVLQSRAFVDCGVNDAHSWMRDEKY